MEIYNREGACTDGDGWCTGGALDVLYNVDLEECKATCLNNPLCVTISYGQRCVQHNSDSWRNGEYCQCVGSGTGSTFIKNLVPSPKICLDASTANNEQYNTIFEQPLDSSKSITFTVQANNDAHVGFFSASKSLSEVYEIVIGGWGNSWSVIRESNQGANQVSASTSQIVSGNEDREFWASADNGLVQFGRGSIVGEQVVLSWQDPNPHEAIYVGVMTGWGATGVWNVCFDA